MDSLSGPVRHSARPTGRPQWFLQFTLRPIHWHCDMSTSAPDSPGRPPTTRVAPLGGTRSWGTLLTLIGFALLLLALYDTQFTIPWPMPRSWYAHQAVWVACAFALVFAGLSLQREPPHRLSPPGFPSGWSPTRPGRRFERLVLLTRPGCHLCEDAQELLAEYADFLPPLEELDIDLHPPLKAAYWDQIPVVQIDGVDRFRGRVDEHLLRRLIEGSPPVEG